MVLQRDTPVPVWGWGPEGETLTVQINATKVATTVVTNGRWRVTLPPMAAGGPHSLLLIPKNETHIRLYSQVLYGDVWLICGQSNMLMPLNDIDAAEREEAVRDRDAFPLIRVAQAGHRNPHTVREARAETVGYWGAVKWETAAYHATRSSSADIPGNHSAVSAFFARALQRHLGADIPVGMIEVGAIMPAESWIDDEEIMASPISDELRGKGYPHATSRCYLANIAPLAPYALKGFIYYQGEMNVGRGEQYRTLLPALIRSWRKVWRNEALPFLIVQLPGYHGKRPGGTAARHALDMPDEILDQLHNESAEHGFCGVREAQLLTRLATPHTGLAVTIDKGDPYDIHPGRKKAVGERVALLARRVAYGEDGLVAEGPLAVEAAFKGVAATVSFLPGGGVLAAPDGTLVGFELAGADGVWGAAEARIVGDTVIVTRAGLAAPQAVRYGWAGYPRYSLFNTDGLPASPFRFPVP